MSSGSEFISNVSNRHEAPAIMTGNEVTFPKPANPGAFGVIYVNNLTGEAFIYTRTGWIPFAGGGQGGVTSADNGLYIFDANTVRLGTNPLVEATTIDMAGFLLEIGNDGNAALVLQPSTGISRLGAFGMATNNAYITVNDTLQLIKLNVDSAGGAFTKGIALDGVNDSYKFGDSQTVALEIFGNPGSGQSFQTLFNGSNYGFIADLNSNYIGVGDMNNAISTTYTNLIIEPASGTCYFSKGFGFDTQFMLLYDNGSYCLTQLGDTSGLYSGTIIRINAGTSNNLIEINSPSGNYQFANVPTYATNTAALAGGLTVGNIYQLGGTLGSASLLSIVY